MVNTKKNKIIVRLTGGLGNQMFIYSAAKALSLKQNKELILDIDDFIYDKRYNRNYELYLFNINDRLASRSEKMKPFRRIRTKLARIKNQRETFKSKRFLERRKIEFDKDFMNIDNKNQPLYISGVWQSYLYFETYREEIRKLFTLKKAFINKDFIDFETKIIKSKNPVSIHFRYFDKPNNLKGNNISMNYYVNCIKDLESKYEKLEYFLFSQYADYSYDFLSKITKNKINIVDGNLSPGKTILLISKCSHHIISNSTFSWWGAWLAKNQNNCIYAPNIYKIHGESFWGFNGLIPKQWKLVETYMMNR